MAIKGNFNGSSSNGGNSNRGRPYGVMLLIAFGAALLGVLVVHKLRERRIFNLLVTDKEQQLFSLHLLLQKEREQSSEMKRKAEDMKAALQKVTTEKMELERRVVELQSSIDSLKDEGKALEIALEEKQSEIKLLRGDATPSEDGDKKSNPQVAESLKQKEAENLELKKHRHRRHHHRGVENPVKVWSAGSDEDPSSKPLSTNGTKAADDAVVAVGQEKKDEASRKLSDGESAIVENNGSDNRRKLSREEGLLPAAVAGSNGTTSPGEAARKTKHVHSRKARGKKWRVGARNRWLGNNKMSNEDDNEEDGEGEGGKRSTTSTMKEIAAVNESGDSSGAQLSKPENSENSSGKRDDRLSKGTFKLEEGNEVSQTDGVAMDASSRNDNNADSIYKKESESVSDSSEQERDEYKDETDPSEF
ncbi:unnamed protein product [Linum trigynum]|uniref:Micronuclear linker histone polyprotein n=1 Tax=Linum trigynum TaxID=586398 RepID=A0AAV2G943_9ROSI